MRINQMIAQATGLGRRSVDAAINQGRVSVNNHTATIGQSVQATDEIRFDDRLIKLSQTKTTVLINKPTGYVCSRLGQGAPTIYDLIPEKYRKLKYIGRLDKDSSGLVVMTDDGILSHALSHPSFNKSKIYLVRLDKPLQLKDQTAIESGKVKLDGRVSLMKIDNLASNKLTMQIILSEGRNRQIRRTFLGLGYIVVSLERQSFGPYKLSQLSGKKYIEL